MRDGGGGGSAFFAAGWGRRALTVVLVVYLAVVAWGTLGPEPGEEIDVAARQVKAAERAVAGEAGSGPGSGSGSAGSADGGGVAGDPRFGGLSGEDVGNVAMFVPFGVLVPLRFRRWRWWTVPAGVALSGLIELTQLVVLSHRSAEWTDVGWNSLGAVIGFGAWAVAAAVAALVARARAA